ncbi:LPS translocon maturation chaperone LptM [Chitiniphilus purpureus]|uniref:LPS translocon maturation chaperone LptM n=1 Tax=Chitiniphilus purpureus TaxID=2981137 RepID=UPI0038CBF421
MRAFLLLILTLGLAGCGFKGPLYLPEAQPAPATPAAAAPATASEPAGAGNS